MPSTSKPAEIWLFQVISALLYCLNRLNDRKTIRLEDFEVGIPNKLKVEAALQNLLTSREEPILSWQLFLSQQQHLTAEAALPFAFEIGASGPSDEDFASAPSLSAWMPVRRPGGGFLCLVGVNVGHPYATGKFIITSQLCGLDENRRWARTITQWYRLGKFVSFDDVAASELQDVRFMGVNAVMLETVYDEIRIEREMLTGS